MISVSNTCIVCIVSLALGVVPPQISTGSSQVFFCVSKPSIVKIQKVVMQIDGSKLKKARQLTPQTFTNIIYWVSSRYFWV